MSERVSLEDHAHGVQVQGSNAVLLIGTLEEAEEYAENHVQAGGADLVVVRVTWVATVGRYIGRQSASGACYVCGRPRSAPSPQCPKRTHP